LISNFKQADDRTLVQHVLGETAQPPLVDALCCVFRSFVEVNVRNQQTSFRASLGNFGNCRHRLTCTEEDVRPSFGVVELWCSAWGLEGWRGQPWWRLIHGTSLH
jgi:hypothetical protein